MAKDDNTKRLYESAKSYNKASEILGATVNLQQNQNVELILPIVVNQALSLELILKCLCHVSGKGELQTHSHRKLFVQLDKKAKKSMIKDFADFISEPKTQEQIKNMEEASKMSMPKSLVDALKTWSDVFVNARYEHEIGGKQLTMMFYDFLFELFVQEVKKIKQDW